ncbi:MAG: DUF433 domain-containing protein [Chitinophagaceae bacterium]|nr:DUF433 domain-containing protein [Chitinophagaceae bacterium]
METALLNRIIIDPAICHGKPSIRGMRYSVDSILEYLSGGDSAEEILEQFPDLEREDILACLAYATASMKLRDIEVPAA